MSPSTFGTNWALLALVGAVVGAETMEAKTKAAELRYPIVRLGNSGQDVAFL